MYGNTAELAPDAAAAQEVRNAVAALNDAMFRAKDLGLSVDIQQASFTPHKVMVSISKRL